MRDLSFNTRPSTILHLDLNSCFATIEQQANPFLRGKSLAVAAYDSPGGCILAPSIEAKCFGVKTGMRVKEGKELCPNLLVMTPDPNKYRQVHLAIRDILSDYTNDFHPKSIDEFVLNMTGMPAIVASSPSDNMQQVAREIKKRIKSEIGEWLTTSVGISTNRFLAKVASNLHKPDGLDEINKNNFLAIYEKLKLTDLSGIALRNEARLNSMGIFKVLDFYNAPLWKLKAAFSGISGYYWYLRLRGWEIDDFISKRGSFGNSYALPKKYDTVEKLSPILSKLCEKTGVRLRAGGFEAYGIHLSLLYEKGFWHKRETLSKSLFDSRDIFREAKRLLWKAPKKKVSIMTVSCFNLVDKKSSQLELFCDVAKKERLVLSVDRINERWGDFTLSAGNSLNLEEMIHDRIAFGGVREL